MSYRHSNAARELEMGNFESAMQRYIFIETAHLVDYKGVFHQSQSDLASQLMVSRVTVSNEFKRLEARGLITKEKFGQYKINLILTPAQAKVEGMAAKPTSDNDEDLLAGMNELDIYWEENSVIDTADNKEVLPVEMDDIPGLILEARKEGKVRIKYPVQIYNGVPCVIYERLT